MATAFLHDDNGVPYEGGTPTNVSTNTTTNIKSGAGFLHRITVNNPGSSWTITVYDSTSGSGTKLATITPSLVGSLEYDVEFTTGLTVVTSGTTAGDITVSSV